MSRNNKWLTGMLGVIVGDALGSPAQFKDRETVKRNPITGMIPCRCFDMPAGSWTDDGSMAIATLDSLVKSEGYNIYDIADRFVDWLDNGKYTPLGFAYDIGMGCENGIRRYKRTKDPFTSGGISERDNGNGSLMRIMPACLYYTFRHNNEELSDTAIKKDIEDISGITHGHIRSKMACVLYYLMVCHVINRPEGESLIECLEKAVEDWKYLYRVELVPSYDYINPSEGDVYHRLMNLSELAKLPESEIKSSGYVVHTIEAVLWNLITTNSFEECLLQAVNLGDDADTVGAITGGIAALYYGLDAIPKDWIKAVVDMGFDVDLCEQADKMFIL